MGAVSTSEQINPMAVGPSTRDIFTLVASVFFTALGIFVVVMTGKPVGYGCLAFFGGCTVFHGWMLRAKLQADRSRLFERVEAIGSVPICANPSHYVALALWLCVSGTSMALSITRAGMTVTWISWAVAAVGLFMLAWLFSGRLVMPFVQFEPEGLRFGRKQYSFLLEWDNIATVKPAEAAHQQALFVGLQSRDRLLETAAVHKPLPDGGNPVLAMIEANQS